jgi:hypothetical protein
MQQLIMNILCYSYEISDRYWPILTEILGPTLQNSVLQRDCVKDK